MPCYIRLMQKLRLRIPLPSQRDKEDFEYELRKLVGASTHSDLSNILNYLYLRDEDELRELFREAWKNYLARKARRRKAAYVV